MVPCLGPVGRAYRGSLHSASSMFGAELSFEGNSSVARPVTELGRRADLGSGGEASMQFVVFPPGLHTSLEQLRFRGAIDGGHLRAQRHPLVVAAPPRETGSADGVGDRAQFLLLTLI